MIKGIATFVLAMLTCAVPLTAQSQEAATGGATRLGLSEFAKQSGHARFDWLQRGVPAGVGLVLLSDERLVLVGPEDLASRMGRAGLPRGSRLPQRGMPAAVSRALGVDYLLGGSYTEFQGEIMLSAFLLDVRNDREIKLNLVTTDEKRLVYGIESLASAVQAVLRKQGVADYSRLFVVPCFEDRTSPATAATNLLRRDLALFLGAQLDARKGTRVVEWRKVEKTCDTPTPDAAVARQFDADAVLGGSFRVQNDVLHVIPTLYVRDGGVHLEMSAVNGPVAQYLQLKVDLGRRVDAVLDGALDNDGRWKISDLTRAARPEDNLTRGRELLEKGDLNLAALHLERASASGSVPDAYFYLGRVQLQQKKFDEAAGSLERYVQLRPQSGPGLRELGMAYAGLRKYDAALTAYGRALQAAPSLEGLHVDVGNAYFLQGKYEDAKRHYREEIARDPGELAAYFNLGLVADREGKEDEAIRWYKDTLRIDPKYARSQQALGELFRKRGERAHEAGDYARAVREYTEEISYRPGAPAYFGRAFARTYLFVQQRKPDYREVVSDYEEAVKRSAGVPIHMDYRRAALINLAEGYILVGRYRDARETAEQAVRELREDLRSRVISRYLLVASQVLMGADYTADLGLLRHDVADPKFNIGPWDFDVLDNFYKETTSVGDPQRRLVQQITEEFKKSAAARNR